MTCRVCGHQNPDDALTCAHCGRRLREGVRRQLHCPRCGADASVGTVRCARCGYDLERVERVPESARKLVCPYCQSRNPPVPPDQTVYCLHCGRLIFVGLPDGSRLAATPDGVIPPGIDGDSSSTLRPDGGFPVVKGVAVVAVAEVVVAAWLGFGPLSFGVAVRYVVLAALAFLALGAAFPRWEQPVASSYLRPLLVFVAVSAALLALAVWWAR